MLRSDLTMSRENTTTTDWVHVVQSEYLEMPGLQLTKAQVRRLWGLEDDTCDMVLEQLQVMQFLRRTARDLYMLDGSTC
jgi:hypothetical protein